MENPTKIWMMTGGSPILGHLHFFKISRSTENLINEQPQNKSTQLRGLPKNPGRAGPKMGELPDTLGFNIKMTG